MELSHVRDAAKLLSEHLPPTPLIRSHLSSESWLKLETQNPTGSFKVRPALYGMLSHLADAKQRGVIASSSGNFAQAVAYAGKKLGVATTIVMPEGTSPFKVERTKALGAEVVLSGPTFEERWQLTHSIRERTGRLMLHPYDSEETIAADGVVGLEILECLSSDFTLLVPVSGGGLLAGTSLAVKSLRPGCRVIGVQPAASGAMKRSFEAGAPVNVGRFATMADALVAACPGTRTFEIARSHVDEIVLVSEEQIRDATRWLFEEQKLVVEPGGAVGVAALRAGLVNVQGTVVCVLSGGNIGLERLAGI